MTFAQLGKLSAFGRGFSKIEIIDDTLSPGLLKAVVEITRSMRQTLRTALDASGPYSIYNTLTLPYVSDALEELTVVISVTAKIDELRDTERPIFLVEVACPGKPDEITTRRHGLRAAVRAVYGSDFALVNVFADGTLAYVLEEDDLGADHCSCQ